MTVKLIHKTRSERGASLSMALMLMLVCVMVASVSLTAASASAGRLSQLKETDENYYNVTSAAKMFWTLMKTDTSGVSTKIERSCTATKDSDSWTYKNCSCSINGRVSNLGQDIVYDCKKSPTVTLFEAAASDAVLHFTSNDGSSSGLVSSTFNVDSDEPDVLLPDYEKINYNKIELNQPHPLRAVSIKIKGQKNSIVEFQFEEAVNPMSFCTLYARLNITNSKPSLSEGVYTFTTNATWEPLYISVGGA